VTQESRVDREGRARRVLDQRHDGGRLRQGRDAWLPAS
jgi:hypothetical protein